MLSENNVTLRALRCSDRERLPGLANNKKIWDNLRDYFPYPYHENDAASFINLTSTEDPRSTFGIEYNGELCGVIGLVRQKDVYRKTADIGYWIGETYWGNGIGKTAVKLITNYGFSQLNLNRIQAGIFEYNKASMRILEKNGYEFEGISRKSVFKNDKSWDEHRYARLNPRFTVASQADVWK